MKLSPLAVSMAVVLLPTLASAEDLTILEWSGYDDPGFFGTYVEKHGKQPDYSFFGEEEEAFQKMMTGFRVDIAHPCSQSVSKWRLAGLLEPIDTSRIARWDEVNEIKETFKYDDGYYFLPTDWGTSALTYRTDEIEASEVESLQVFQNPEYEGRMSLPDNVDDVYALAYLATGVSDWTTATQEDFEKASAWLRQVHPNIRTYWADGAELAQLMTTGEVLISWAWNETPTTLIANDVPVASNREATEGSSTWFCGYVNVVDGPNSEDLMYDFFNAWTEPGSTDYIVSAWGYGGSNQVAMEALGEEALVDVGLGAVSAPVLSQAPMDIELREKMVAEFEMIKAGF